MLKPSLQLRIGQKLAMTPQLQQAIRLLQLSSLELVNEVRQALDENVMLEAEQDPDPATANDDGATRDTDGQASATATSESTPGNVEARHETPDYYYSPATGGGWQDEIAEDRRPENALPEDLHHHLYWQLDMAPFSDRDRAIGRAIIDAIDEDGYLGESVEALTAALASGERAESQLEGEEVPDEEEVRMVLHRIQTFDPAGVGATDLGECLDLQLHALAAEGAEVELARRLVRDHLRELARAQPDKLARRLKVDEDALRTALAVIRSLHPRPGLRVQPERAEYVIPDVVISRHEGRWLVELNSEITPSIRVNSMYADAVSRSRGGDEFEAMRGQLREARWLVRSLEMRNDTLIRVASAIIEHQQDFLEYGEEYMKPLVLAEIAEAVGLHESTISRVTTRKYMLTPRGVFEFKYFFSTQLARSDGGETSATAVRARIKRLIAEEDPAKPLSDSRLVQDLKSEGFRVARRTVAKYREAMAIPPSHERKRVDV